MAGPETTNLQQEALDFANSIVETVREPLLILDAELRVVRANRAFYRTFAVDADTTEQQRIYDLGNGQWNIPALRTLLEEIIPQNAAFDDFAVTHTFPTLGQRTMLLNARKLYRPGNHTETILVAIADITEQRVAQEEQERLLALAQTAQAAAEQATLVRDHFLSIAGHELKNPLTTLLGNLQLVQRWLGAGEQSDRTQRALQGSIDQARRLNQLINSLFDLSRLQGQHTHEQDTDVVLCALVQQLVESIEPVLDRHTIAWSCPDEPLAIRGDALRLEQAISNLISNAIKYSPVGGHIQVTVERRANEVCVDVEDQGLGIPEAEQQHLFDLFYRVHMDKPTPIEGMGIGLYVVHQITQYHGGRIEMDSHSGAGSRFSLCFPRLGIPAA